MKSLKTTITIATMCLFIFAGTHAAKAQTFEFTTNFINDQIMKYNFMRKPITIDRAGNLKDMNGFRDFNLLELDSGKKRIFYELKGGDGIYLFKEKLRNQRFDYKYTIEFSVENCTGGDSCPALIMYNEEAALSTYNAFKHLLTLIN